jgi:hypothetical protein
MVRVLVGLDYECIVDAGFSTTVYSAGQPFLIGDTLHFSKVKYGSLHIVN